MLLSSFDLRQDEEPWSDDQDGLPFDNPAHARFGRRIQARPRDRDPHPIVTLSITVEPPV